MPSYSDIMDDMGVVVPRRYNSNSDSHRILRNSKILEAYLCYTRKTMRKRTKRKTSNLSKAIDV
ncbi:hypothetical protein X777_09921 [Ooceraea biroi]|uniref:Uncharacterized protein n=1 Tax=Ooceraea biroi TaxID=2015173 RepID=A0A026W896_OOCBI|nr:hypothetical protein X777_09921 [Ooceraea biroi]